MTKRPPPRLQLDYRTVPPKVERPVGMAVASLVCGILSVPLFCVWLLAIPMATTAVLLGWVPRNRARRGEADWAGVAIAGITLGAVVLLPWIVILSFVLFDALFPGRLR